MTPNRTYNCADLFFCCSQFCQEGGFPSGAAGALLHGIIPPKEKLWAVLSCNSERPGPCYPRGLKPLLSLHLLSAHKGTVFPYKGAGHPQKVKADVPLQDPLVLGGYTLSLLPKVTSQTMRTSSVDWSPHNQDVDSSHSEVQCHASAEEQEFKIDKNRRPDVVCSKAM